MIDASIKRLYECQSIVRRRLQYSAAILARLHNPILNLVQSPLDPADQERLDSRCSTIWEDQIFDRDFEEAQAAFHTAAASAPWFCPITREASTYLKLNLPTASVSAQGLGLDLPSLPDNEDVLYANELLQHPDPFPKAVEGATRRLDAAITGHLAYLHVRLQSAFTQCFDGMFAPTVLHLIHRRILEPLIDQGLSQTKEALKNRARELWLSIRSAPERNVPEFCARVDFILESFRITRNAYLATLGECAQHERERPLFPEQLPESRESRSAPSDIGETQSILVDNLKALNLGSSANLVRSQLQEGDFDPAYWVAALVEAGSPSVAQELLSSYPAIVQRNLIAHVREGARAALSGPLCNISVEEKAAVEEVLQRYERICNSVRGYTEVEGGVESEEEDGGGEIQ
ncbi:hypothetical protein SISSUDRAFT_576891 [Sistotremastrum suecicum HHB10207 ss-3]|uniref:Uncharacterized protein n=1 Tax=Sistotremastrum suecicum HHB10207 ss-3 TaxID=1314776 RepID=A0A165XFA5_9AGAM|nr:hypothetical protein SISSUDRAFT_576891 [Sistotremastrum suecicum HHB10207 ss-3]